MQILPVNNSVEFRGHFEKSCIEQEARRSRHASVIRREPHRRNQSCRKVDPEMWIGQVVERFCADGITIRSL